MLMDFYELTMARGHMLAGSLGKIAVFDLYFRKNPFDGGYTVAAGLEQAIDYVQNMRFTGGDIDFLREQDVSFGGEMAEWLRGFKFSGDIHAVGEGRVVFPGEPLVRVRAPIAEAQLIETALLNIINHQSLIATKAARIKEAVGSDPVLEFGARRAHGPDAAVYGARAAAIAGIFQTSDALAGRMFGIPLAGTVAHSWIQSFDDELTAFRTYAEVFPNRLVLLVDTYSTLESGVPNAIRVFSEMRAAGTLPAAYGVRIDSGDLAYFSKRAREMLDAAGFPKATICASSDLDEFLISSLKSQGARIDVWGVGTNLITAAGWQALGGVYKMAAEVRGGEAVPKIKLSENHEKITNPGVKDVYRLYDARTRKIKADIIALEGERIDESREMVIFDPRDTWKKMRLRPGEYTVEPLLAPVMAGGERVYEPPSLARIAEICRADMDSLWDEYKRLVNPHILPVDLSEELYALKTRMIREAKGV
ncbi:MAG: nicotinate phosphoribosyltransferase [Clostridiales bacterium]|jgi:nicotinate phosphoribosyltransferase|nr:nicotinate phosphoribosyltransferase [Clostridiales bacterium]